MTSQILSNIIKFLERVPVNGLESYAWCEAHQAVNAEIVRLATPVKEKSDATAE